MNLKWRELGGACFLSKRPGPRHGSVPSSTSDLTLDTRGEGPVGARYHLAWTQANLGSEIEDWTVVKLAILSDGLIVGKLTEISLFRTVSLCEAYVLVLLLIPTVTPTSRVPSTSSTPTRRFGGNRQRRHTRTTGALRGDVSRVSQRPTTLTGAHGVAGFTGDNNSTRSGTCGCTASASGSTAHTTADTTSTNSTDTN